MSGRDRIGHVHLCRLLVNTFWFSSHELRSCEDLDTSCDKIMEDIVTECIPPCKRESKAKQLTGDQRNAILKLLLQHRIGNKLSRGAIGKIAIQFEVSRLTISRIWHRAREQFEKGAVCAEVSSKKNEKCGRKNKDYSSLLSKLKDIPVERRRTIRSLSNAIGIPKSTLYRLVFQQGNQLKRIQTSAKPTLSDENRWVRLEFCLSMVKPNGFFEDMYDYVHVDVKWFYVTRVKGSYYIMVDENGPEKTCETKRFITKVMMMAAVARSRYDIVTKQYFEGKIGLWPFVYQEPAKRNSKNQPKGALVTRPIETVTSVECKNMIIDNVLPSIRSKMPVSCKAMPIYVQFDSAKSHFSIDNDDVLAAECSKDGWNVVLKSQPPNSPDLNVLNLGFFNSVQSLQYQVSPKTVDKLVECVHEAFNALTKEKLDNVFLTLQWCMESTMFASGGNGYKIQHMNKEKLRREGRLPVSMLCSEEALYLAHYKNVNN